MTLLDKRVTDVFAVSRSTTGQQHPKLHEVVHKDFTDFSTLELDADACFWCLGVTSVGMSEADYTRITYDFRPGVNQPLHGIRSRTRLYNILYPVLYPLLLIGEADQARIRHHH